MAGTLASLEPTLERVYAPKKVVEQLYQENRFWEKIKKTDQYTIGEEARVVLHDRRNGGFTNLPEGGGALNKAGQQGFRKAGFKYKNHHQQVEIQGEAIDGTKGDANAIVEAVDVEIQGAINDMNRQLTRQSYMGGNALITACRTSSSNNVDLNLIEGLNAIERGWIYEGQQVMVGTTASAESVVTKTEVTAVDEANVAFTVASGAVTTESATSFVSNVGGRVGTASNEMNGLRNIVSANELGGLTAATSPVWAATVNSTTTQLTIAALLQAQQKIRQRQGKTPNFFLTGLKQQRRFYELLEQQVRYNSDGGLNAGGDESAKWNGMEIFGDPDCWDEDLYMGHFEHLFMVAMKDPYWQNAITGGNMLSWAQGFDAYVGKLTYRANLAANRRNDLYRFSALT